MGLQQKFLLSLGLMASVALAALGCAPASESVPQAPQSQLNEQSTGVSPERTIPDSCAALNLAPGVALDGTDLGTCLTESLSSYGSGRMQMTTDTVGEIEFTYSPEYNFQGNFEGPDGPVRMSFVDGVMWIDLGDGPVKGDIESDNFDEQMAGMAGELYRFYSDLEQTVQLIALQPTWNVVGEKETVALPTGEQVEAYRIVSGGSFVWNEVPVSEFVVWFGEDWVPVSTQATMEMMGMSVTNSQKFYDLGEKIVITPLG